MLEVRFVWFQIDEGRLIVAEMIEIYVNRYPENIDINSLQDFKDDDDYNTGYATRDLAFKALDSVASKIKRGGFTLIERVY